VTPEIYAGYRKPLQVENWDKALWELTKSSRESGLALRLDELNLPVLVVTGDDDRIVPTENSLQLAKDVPGSQLVVFETAAIYRRKNARRLFWMRSFGLFKLLGSSTNTMKRWLF
jgi:fermentation-respiration switch protein FrsA (DUF1100 family)